ncbi:MAG TPA: exodeoxyribonuclease VII large subunit, partial [Lachnospiraceae bacterium]|nr:exodeoxyribonuclease VII large subunit [Lachnospiraceae bacterium]
MENRIYSVSWINAYIHNMISQDFLLKQVCVKGEASNVKYHSSGHLYFTLKDEKAAIACAMFAGKRGGLKFKLEEGQKIVVSGTVDIYEKDGNTRLYAEKITLEGVGELYERFERLKEDLEDRGLFAPEYKRALPKHIKTLGVVTASTGAAVRDIINIAKRRDPGIEILLYPAKVQGEGAAESIEKGIEVLNASRAEIIIVGRGGGSIEDLWAFNEEKVAMAIFNCEKPVISAVGHETDYTIADFVADMRAPTPSAAAELA